MTRRSLRLIAMAIAIVALEAHAAGAVPVGAPEDVGMSSDRLARIGVVVAQHIEDGNVAGAVTLVARRGRIVHFEAHGLANIATREPMTTDAIFRLASMSKPVTAVAVMMLVEEGKITLSDPVAKYIPELAELTTVAVARPNASGGDGGPAYDLVTAHRAITIYDLLTHGSGLVSGGLGAAAATDLAPRRPDDTLATYVPRLANVPLDFQPGTLWRYSGLAGFDVLSRIVEVVSGQSFDAYLEETLFEPLGMSDTAFYFSGGQQRRVATMHARRDGVLEAVERPLDRVYFSGAGGLASSAEDYLQFAQMLLNRGELGGRRYLGTRTVELMAANHTGDMVNGQFGRPPRGMGFGLSMQVVEDPVAAQLAVSKGAYGWAGGTGVSFWVEPAEELVSLYMIQGGSGGALRSAFEMAVRQAIIE